MEEQLFYLVARTLKRLELDTDKMPTNLQKWQEFLSRINRGYFDFEQERYLLERSMDISSREMLELNDKFEQAQITAHIGLWVYDKLDERLLWSKETYRLFGISSALAAPTFNDILVFLHEDDRKTFSDLFTNALQATKSYEMEFRIYNQLDGKMRWAFLKGEVQPLQDKNKPFRYFSGIMMDITEQKKAEEQLSELQQKLLLTARQAGMSEIAASVLHNIGNILNSVNISISVIKELLEKIKPEYLKKTVGILQDSLPENSADFTNDTKGKLAFNYILEFSDHLNIQLADINKEISVLNTNVQHIKSVLHMQNAISGVININEKVSLNDAIDYAIQIGCGVWEELEINIIKSFKENITLMIDKSKLLQILINLMKNAKETVILSEKKEKNIIIEITQDYDNHNVSISIRDNGIGIESENLTKIFSLGYTTKKEGHGFGLHGSANTAKELGGSLRAESTGRNEGAVFILSLPNKEK